MLYMPIWYVLRWPLQFLYRLRLSHRERIPVEGPAIICANHNSYVDPLIVALLVARPIRYMAKSELFAGGPLAWVMRGVGSFPVRRGTADRRAVKRATDLLDAGGLVGIFPEGTRRSQGEAYGGAALIAQRAGVPVIPVGVAGTAGIMPEGTRFPRAPRVAAWVGEPISPVEDPEDRREAIRALTGRIMEGIASAVKAAEATREKDARGPEGDADRGYPHS